ncbi:hypothetical protein FD755_013973 [Muntiacus reevesi]|uniref:Uncharacterized protein n=1 Tax=Muntiacus reevesi TaxID=9886 RepID=A0A5N3XKH3_MUNRE|nr:hypothetical protein FD755_013973 [Muntiacus reevesi]
MSTLANPPSILEMPQEIKKSCGDKQVEITVERIKMAKSLKEKQSNDLEKVAFKRKAEGDEKPAGKKEAKIIELDSLLITMPLPHIPLKNVMDVEVKLVYVDEENVSYEFVECDPSTGNQPTCRAAEIVDPLREPNFSVLPQIDKWLQVALKDASSCYRQKKYAVAAGQFRTALEKLLTVERKLSVDSRKNHGNYPVSDYYMGGGAITDLYTPFKIPYHVPPPMGFTRQEYWSGLPFPSPGDLPDPGIKPSTTYPSPNGIFNSDFIMQELLKVLFFFTSWCSNLGLIPGSGRPAGEGVGYPLQYFGHLIRRTDSLEKTLISKSMFKLSLYFLSSSFLCTVRIQFKTLMPQRILSNSVVYHHILNPYPFGS